MTTMTLDRRDFLRVSAAGTSGFLLGFYLPSSAAEPTNAPFEPNAWLRIAPDGIVTITVAKQEMGQGVLTSLSMIVADELEADWSKVRAVQADAHPNKYGGQGTGGSSSVRTSYEKLRNAGATARGMLIAAAAAAWNAPVADCRAEQGSVINVRNGKKLGYGELASAAASMPVPEKPAFKDPKDFHLIGKRVKKLDTPSKIDGSAVYGIDIRVPGMVFASLVRCPVFGGKVATFDAAGAKSVDGVLDVVQTEDGVAVVAKHTWAALRGRDALKITWDEGANAGRSSDATWKEFAAKAQELGTVDRTVGDPSAAFATAKRVVEAVYKAPLVAHATMEPMNCTVRIDGETCEVWVPTQVPQRAQSEAAKVLGLPVESVTVHVTHIGGGFGRRLNADYVVETVRIAKAVSKPVQLLWTREDDMTHDFYRPNAYGVFKAGLDGTGAPTVWTHRAVGPNSKGLVVSGSFPPYQIPNVTVDYHLIDTGVPIGAWRSVGPGLNAWLVESFIDELAHAAGKDPLDYRLSLLKHQPRFTRALTTAAEKAGWRKPAPQGVARGIAVAEDCGTVVAEVAEVSVVRGEVKVHRVVAAVDCGPYVNPDTIEAQVEGAIVYGLTVALKGEITVAGGRVEQANFDAYPMMRIDDMPKVEIVLIESDAPMGGIGEPGLPPAAPAVCNAIFALTGTRVRQLPIRLA